MNANKQKISELLTYICINKPKGPEARMWWKEGLPGVVLDWDLDMKFAETIREILREPIVFENFTVKEIESQLQDIISNGFRWPLSLRQTYVIISVKKMFASFYSQIEEYTFVIPIHNLQVVQSFSIGDVTFKNFSEFQRKKWVGVQARIIKNNPHLTKDQKKSFNNRLKEELLKPLVGNACAETKCRAREERAKEIAFMKVSTAIDIIKLYCLYGKRASDCVFGLKGEVLVSSIRTVLQLTTSGSPVFTPTLERIGPLLPLRIERSELKRMQKLGLSKFGKITQNSKKTWVEKKLLRATYWYSRVLDTPLRRIDDEKIVIKRELMSSLTGESLEYSCINERLVKAFVALESLFAINKNEAIQNNIAERVAFLLTKDYQERKAIKRFLKDTYDFRSNIVHRGHTYVSSKELNRLMNIVRDSIIILMLKRNKLGLKSSEDFYEYFEKQKLS